MMWNLGTGTILNLPYLPSPFYGSYFILFILISLIIFGEVCTKLT